MAYISSQILVLFENGSRLKESVLKVDFNCLEMLVVNFHRLQHFDGMLDFEGLLAFKPLKPQDTKAYQWKDNVHTFHLIPRNHPV